MCESFGSGSPEGEDLGAKVDGLLSKTQAALLKREKAVAAGNADQVVKLEARAARLIKEADLSMQLMGRLRRQILALSRRVRGLLREIDSLESPRRAPRTEAGRKKRDSDLAKRASSDRNSPTEAFDEAASEIANAPAEAQAAMIQSMVQNLAARLEDDPSDLDGWRMLARSYSVLGRSSDAKDKLLAAIENQNNGTLLRANLERLALEIYGTEVN
jgi:hypothetical protein